MRGIRFWRVFFGICLFGFALKFSYGKPEAQIDDTAVSAEQVKAEFLHAWTAYKKYAWGHDELKPLSKGYSDWYKQPLLMTPVDAYDTMLIMGLDKEAKEAKELIMSKLSFDRDFEVQHFEVNIRILGGLISAYQLDGDKRFLELAIDLANRMMPVFESKTGMPYRFVNLKTGKTSGAITNPAEVGTYILEYGTLSKLTGNPVYYEKAKRAVIALNSRSSELGLVGTSIDVNSGKWVFNDANIGGGIDSYYEYLLKGAILFNDPDLKKMWETHLNAINTYLADESTGRLWYGHANMTTGKRTLSLFGALDAFFPALLALGGDIERASRLEDSCYQMWILHSLEPEMIDYKKMRIIADSYQLRPEIIESAYYLYHYTGDEKYRKMGYVYFNSIVKYCKTEAGYAVLSNVRTKKQADSMPSYFLAETLKYFYLLFAKPDDFNFDRVIFNTEAHPISRQN
jgi:mannosidase alpha-like ER degradation enhancer 2